MWNTRRNLQRTDHKLWKLGFSDGSNSSKITCGSAQILFIWFYCIMSGNAANPTINYVNSAGGRWEHQFLGLEHSCFPVPNTCAGLLISLPYCCCLYLTATLCPPPHFLRFTFICVSLCVTCTYVYVSKASRRGRWIPLGDPVFPPSLRQGLLPHLDPRASGYSPVSISPGQAGITVFANASCFCLGSGDPELIRLEWQVLPPQWASPQPRVVWDRWLNHMYIDKVSENLYFGYILD